LVTIIHCQFLFDGLHGYALTPFQKLPIAGLSLELAIIDHELTAREYSLDHTLNLPAFIGAVVNVHMVSLSANGLFPFGIKDDNVRIRAYGDRPLLWQHPKHLPGGR